jgi:quinoprotein glucose dehydrogenase
VLPGFDGGGEWGGAAVDGETGIIYVNASDVPWIAAMREVVKTRTQQSTWRSGQQVYAALCASCHGDQRQGRDRAPSLVDVASRMSADQIRQVIERGRGFMPAFANLPEEEKVALIAYLRAEPSTARRTAAAPEQPVAADANLSTTQYEFVGYERWRDSSGYPAIKPPWGTLSAIDLNTGQYVWRIPLGEHEALKSRGIPATGTELYGGPIVTAGGLVFIAATQDAKFRAFDKATGKLLWETTLPAAGYATPMTYSVGGKQYIVIAAGGGKLGSKSGDAYVGFALPD